jgi:hypothetical protein
MSKHAAKSLSWTVAVRLWLWTEVSSFAIRFAGFAERRWRFALYEKTGVWTKTFSETISDLEGK